MSKLIKRIGELNSQQDKAAITQLAKQHAEQILNTNQYDLLQIYVEFKRYETYLKALVDTVKPTALAKAKAKNNSIFDYAGATIKVGRQRKYDYSTDDYWRSTNETLEQLKDLKKNREQFLKGIKGTHRDMVDPETGEVLTVFAPETSIKEVLAVIL